MQNSNRKNQNFNLIDTYLSGNNAIWIWVKLWLLNVKIHILKIILNSFNAVLRFRTVTNES